jgi:tRNA 2-thiouridine synthesizing protein C
MQKKHLAFVLRSSPYESTKAQEGLDAILAASVFEQFISIIFYGDGVFQLIENQMPNPQKNLGKMLGALHLYEIDQIFIQETALIQRNIQTSQLIKIGALSSDARIAKVLGSADHVLSF